MLRGGVIMDVVDAEQAKVAEDAGACAVMALERVPADIRRDGGVARMSDPEMIEGIKAEVSIPVMAKCRIGHFAEAQVLETLGKMTVLELVELKNKIEAQERRYRHSIPLIQKLTAAGSDGTTTSGWSSDSSA